MCQLRRRMNMVGLENTAINCKKSLFLSYRIILSLDQIILHIQSTNVKKTENNSKHYEIKKATSNESQTH